MAAVASSATLRARSVTSREQLVAFLRRDRLYAAYALADLDGPQRRRAAWGIAYAQDGEAVALGMHQEGLVPQPLFLMGDPAGCRAVLDGVLKPRDAWFQATDAHQAELATLYALEPPVRMLRMVVDRGTFRPFAGPAERLGSRDLEDLNALYQLGFRSGFPASVVADGVYYGVRIGGRLVSAAGTHGINPREGMGIVGNVMTHAEYRGQDFAKMVTSAVTAELLRRLPDVALNVHADNTPAVAAYARLGFRTHCELIERLGRRRHGGWGLMKPLREAIRLTWSRDTR